MHIWKSLSFIFSFLRNLTVADTSPVQMAPCGVAHVWMQLARWPFETTTTTATTPPPPAASTSRSGDGPSYDPSSPISTFSSCGAVVPSASSASSNRRPATRHQWYYAVPYEEACVLSAEGLPMLRPGFRRLTVFVRTDAQRGRDGSASVGTPSVTGTVSRKGKSLVSAKRQPPPESIPQIFYYRPFAVSTADRRRIADFALGGEGQRGSAVDSAAAAAAAANATDSELRRAEWLTLSRESADGAVQVLRLLSGGLEPDTGFQVLDLPSPVSQPGGRSIEAPRSTDGERRSLQQQLRCRDSLSVSSPEMSNRATTPTASGSAAPPRKTSNSANSGQRQSTVRRFVIDENTVDPEAFLTPPSAEFPSSVSPAVVSLDAPARTNPNTPTSPTAVRAAAHSSQAQPTVTDTTPAQPITAPFWMANLRTPPPEDQRRAPRRQHPLSPPSTPAKRDRLGVPRELLDAHSQRYPTEQRASQLSNASTIPFQFSRGLHPDRQHRMQQRPVPRDREHRLSHPISPLSLDGRLVASANAPVITARPRRKRTTPHRPPTETAPHLLPGVGCPYRRRRPGRVLPLPQHKGFWKPTALIDVSSNLPQS